MILLRAALFAALTLGAPLAAQQTGDVAAEARRALTGTGAILRGLDKTTGTVRDLQIGEGGSDRFGRLAVRVGQCRYPEDNPTGEAYAWVEVTDEVTGSEAFAGWMIASAPALNALDHARYDVWVIRCTTR